MKSIKVLIAAPLKQERHIFAEYQAGLDALIIPDGVTVDRFFAVNDCKSVIPDIRGEYEVINTGDGYKKTATTHIWTHDNLTKMHELRNACIRRAEGYDYLFSVDTDLVLHPMTLLTLLAADKEIVSEVFWTNGWCNAWLYDQADGMPEEWKTAGLYRC